MHLRTAITDGMIDGTEMSANSSFRDVDGVLEGYGGSNGDQSLFLGNVHGAGDDFAYSGTFNGLTSPEQD